jgi:hypothetical protein
MGPAMDRQIVIAFFQLLRNREGKLAFASVDPSSGQEVITSARVDTATDMLVLLEKSDESYMSILIPAIDFFWMNPAWAPQFCSTSVRIADNPTGTRKSHLRRARMSNSDLSNRRVRSLPKKMTLSAQPHFLTVQSAEERFKPLDQM